MPATLVSIIALGMLVTLAFCFERSHFSVKEMALVVALAALAACARVPFAVIPGVQPTTAIVMISGFLFGPLMGSLVGALSALVSNVFLGQGPWTLWQMLAWALCGCSSGWLTRCVPAMPRLVLLLFGFCWGYAYGWILNTWVWLATAFPLSFKTFFVFQGYSFAFDTLHAFGNVIFLGIFGGDFLRILTRFRAKLHTSYLVR